MGRPEAKKYSKGYTLVELVVVCAIIGIIALISIGGLLSYQKYAQFQKNNEYAQTLYAAAQSSILYADSGNQIENLMQSVKADNVGTKLRSGMVDNGYTIGEEEEALELYSLRFYGSDDKENYDEAHRVVYNLIAPYVYDQEILSGSFCVELDLSNSQILGVFYLDQEKELYYNSIESQGEISLVDRNYEVRREDSLGYYGVEKVGEGIGTGVPAPNVAKIELYNEETLFLKWNLQEEYKNIAGNLTYTIALFEEDEEGRKRERVQLTINDEISSSNRIKSKDAVGSLDELTVICDVTLFDYDEEGNQETTLLRKQTFLAYVNNLSEIVLVLDLVDKNDVYSIQRLGLDGDHQVSAAVCVSGSGYTKSEWSMYSNWENAMFAESKEQTDAMGMGTEYQYFLSNGRHLSNIRYMEEKKEKAIIPIGNYTYIQNKDIVWAGKDGMVEKEALFETNNGDLVLVTPEQEVEAQGMRPIASLHKTSTLLGKQGGKQTTIYNLVICETGTAALFGRNEGTIKNLLVEGVYISGGDYVGTITGINAGIVEDVQLKRSSAYNLVRGYHYVGGLVGSDVGGVKKTMPGNEEGFFELGTYRQYKNLENDLRVEGQMFVGGIVGYMNGVYLAQDNQQETIALESCVNTGYIKALEDKALEEGSFRCFGGIVGYAEETKLVDCKNKVLLEEAWRIALEASIKSNELRGDFVGGLIGYYRTQEKEDILNQVMENCESGDKTKDTYVVGGNFVGGYIGYFSSKEAYTFDGQGTANENLVIGKNYAGGIAGAITTAEVQDLKEIETVILAENLEIPVNLEVTMINWENNAGVSVSNRYAGGILGYNSGLLLGCNVNVTKTLDKGLEQKGNYIGGAVGYNAGTIQQVALTSEVRSEGIYVGGIAGYNDALISECSVGSVSIQGNKYLGGIAGYNSQKGRIIGAESRTEVRAIVGRSTLSANIGGITGVNDGTIRNYNFTGSLLGESGSNNGYGGIAGVNNGNITQCNLKGGIIEASGKNTESINIGGIVGRNTGSVSNCYVETTNANITVKAKETSNLGGIVGYNNGVVRSCGDAPNNTRNVSISGRRGHMGGIVGYNDRNGQVSDCTTSARWTVSADRYQSDDGTGGIIGYNSSIRTISNNTNKATVTRTATGTTGVGGIVGRQEIQSGVGRITACVNEGPVTGESCVGGIVGRMKYGSSIIEDCDNYGTIKITNSYGAGIVGNWYRGSANATTTIKNARNFGTITSTKNSFVAGIMGGVQGGTDQYLNIENCVNIGGIQAVGSGVASTAAGILGGAADGTNVVMNVIRGRNYGMSTGSAQINGIYGSGTSNNKANLIDCFGIAQLNQPTARPNMASSLKSTYYFASGNSGSDAGIALSVRQIQDNGQTKWVGESNNHKVSVGPLSGNPLTVTSQAQALGMYQTIDDELLLYYNSLTTAKLSEPTKVEVKDTRSTTLNISWSLDKEALYTQVTAKVFEDEQKTILKEQVTLNIYGAENTVLELEEEWEDCFIEISVRAMSSTDENSSQEVKSENLISVGSFLPQPKVHLELVANSSGNYRYQAVLENAEDYAALNQTETITVHVTPMNTTDQVTIDVRQGKSALYELRSSETGVLKSYASTTNTAYRNSHMGEYETRGYTDGNWKSTTAFAAFTTGVADPGFVYNGTENTYKYSVNLKPSNKHLIYQTELLAVDQELGVPIIIGSTLTTLAGTGDMGAIITGLPKEIEEMGIVTIRSQPYSGQNKGVWYSILKEEDLSKEELLAYEVSSGEFLINQGVLASGYSIEKTENETYNLHFSEVLKNANLNQHVATETFVFQNNSWVKPNMRSFSLNKTNGGLAPVEDVKLSVPSLSGLKIVNESLSAIALEMEDSAVTIDGTYEVEAIVYSDEARQEKVETRSGVFQGDLKRGTYVFAPFNDEYAGYYLSVKIRSKSHTGEQSEWTKEQSYRLPRIQLETPVLHTNVERQEEALYEQILWDGVENATGYEIQLQEGNNSYALNIEQLETKKEFLVTSNGRTLRPDSMEEQRSTMLQNLQKATYIYRIGEELYLECSIDQTKQVPQYQYKIRFKELLSNQGSLLANTNQYAIVAKIKAKNDQSGKFETSKESWLRIILQEQESKGASKKIENEESNGANN